MSCKISTHEVHKLFNLKKSHVDDWSHVEWGRWIRREGGTGSPYVALLHAAPPPPPSPQPTRHKALNEIVAGAFERNQRPQFDPISNLKRFPFFHPNNGARWTLQKHAQRISWWLRLHRIKSVSDFIPSKVQKTQASGSLSR